MDFKYFALQYTDKKDSNKHFEARNELVLYLNNLMKRNKIKWSH